MSNAELFDYEVEPARVDAEGVSHKAKRKKLMAGINLSQCCHAPINEHPSMDPETFIYKCTKCNRVCNVINAKIVKQKIKAYLNKNKTPLDEKTAKVLETLNGKSPDYVESDTPEPAPPEAAAAQQPEAPKPKTTPGLEVRDGQIYENGKLVGNIAPITDEQWYREQFGKEPDEWAMQNLAQLRKQFE